MGRSLIIVLLGSFGPTLHAQSWAFGSHAGGPGNDYGSRVAMDAAGNSIVAGEFSGTIAFDTITLSSQGTWSVFLTKYTAEGNVAWATVIATTHDPASDIYANAVALDTSGNIYVAGNFLIGATFSDVVVQSTGTSDLYLAKLNGHGDLVWVRTAGGPGEGTFAQDAATGLALDDEGNCYITGYYNTTALFDSISISSSNTMEIFVAKYDNDGRARWATSAGGVGAFHASLGIAIDSHGNSYITGRFFNGLTFGDDSLNAGDPEQKIFIAKFDANGSPLWARKVGSGGYYGQGQGVAVSPDGDIYIVGYFRSTIYFDGTTLSHDNGTSYAALIARYDSSGKFVWAIHSGNDNGSGSKVRLDRQGNVLVTGGFTGRIRLGARELDAPSATHGNAFIAKLDARGECQWLQGVIGVGSATGNDIAAGSSGNCVVVGNFMDTVTVGSTQLISVGGSDIFVARLDDDQTTDAGSHDGNRSDRPLFYPNPAGNTVTLDADGPHGRIEILSLQGSIMLETDYTRRIDIGGLASGVYFLRIGGVVRELVKL